MDPFIRKVKSQAEKDALMAEAKKVWDQLGSVSHLVCSDEESYLTNVSNSIEVERESFTPARALTAEELVAQDGGLMFSRIYGDRADSGKFGCAAIDDLMAKRERDDLEKLLGPGRRAESALEITVRELVHKAMSNPSHVPSEHDRSHIAIAPQGVHPVMMAAATDDSPTAKFVAAWINKDTAAMRQIARSLAEAA